MRIAVVGGGINGLCTAWELAKAGHQVELFERDNLMQATSRSLSKLLHGGLRYLEQGQFRLVQEALQERRWWLQKTKQLTRRIPLLYPIYSHGRRPRWQLKIGLLLYDFFAGRTGIGRHRWLTTKQTLRCSPQLKADGLQGAYLFFDGQMDDYQLGLWVAKQCRKAGAILSEQQPVLQLKTDGSLLLNQGWQQFDRVINVAGPWSESLLKQSGLAPQQALDLVRGSHLLLPSISRYGHMLEVPQSNRIVFALPYQRKCLLGTTEVRQSIKEAIACSDAERDELLATFNHYFQPGAQVADVLDSFAGVRPLLAGSKDSSRASREYSLRWQQQLLTVSGGKWTTARALARQVLLQVQQSHPDK